MSRPASYQPEAMVSLELIRSTTPDLVAPILDMGDGSSTLVDGLVEAGYRQVTVLDLASASLGSQRGARRKWAASLR